MKKSIFILSLLLILLNCKTADKKGGDLQNKINQITSDKKALIGVSILNLDGREVASINGQEKLPMQSVYKFHIALAVLSEVDRGRFSLDQKIDIKKSDWYPNTWSPMRDDNPEGGSFTVAQLLEYAVSKSDNIACDELLKLLGSPKNVDAYIKSQGIKNVSIKLTEKEMQATWDAMYENWTTPHAASEIAYKFYTDKKLLSQKSHDFLWKIMHETNTGENRLKGNLPNGTIVAHKTGTSGRKDGVLAACNDMGIVMLPNGNYFVITVFVTQSKENDAENEKIIAEISKAAYDYFLANKL